MPYIPALSCNCVYDDFVYEPWLARGIHELGVKVIGVDLNNNCTEKFENYIVDLNKTNCLHFFKDNSVDVACTYALFDSHSVKNPKKIFSNLLPQLGRIIKPEGYFIFDPINVM